MARTASIGVRIQPIVKEALERAAAEDRRSVASLIELVLVKYLEERGHLPKGAAE